MTRISPGWLSKARTQKVMAALAPLSPLFVGGCVRDALMGRAGQDVDICVAAPPEEAMRAAAAAGLGVHPTGIDHGVITVTLKGAAFEVASLRRDVATDGRRAVVAWTSDITEDAARRDFTVNALYATAEGKVIDPNGAGIDDLRAGRLCFVGDAAQRIREDYLRILRLFRFQAKLGLSPEPAEIAICQSLAGGLAHISRERIGAEMLKLLSAPDPEPALAAMGDVLEAALPGASFTPGLTKTEQESAQAPEPMRRLAMLGAENPPSALRLSNAEKKTLSAIMNALATEEPPAISAWRHGQGAARDAALIRAARGAPLPQNWLSELARGGSAELPIAASDLIKAGAKPGPELGAMLRRAEAAFIASDLKAGPGDLIAAAFSDAGR